MTAVLRRDVLVYAGGDALTRYGRFTRVTHPSEDTGETFTRSGAVGPYTDRGGKLLAAEANVPRVEWLDLDGDGIFDTPSLLLEAARTNLVSSDNVSAWSVSGTPVVTGSVSDPAGGTGAYTVEDNDGAAHEYPFRNVAFTGDGVKSCVFVVRENTHPASGSSLVLVDTTAVSIRLEIRITAWTGGEPTASAPTTGTYLGKRYLGNGYWALYGQSTAVTAANTNRIEIRAAFSNTETGSIDVYRVNAYDVASPPWSILDASEARNGDTWYTAFAHKPQAMSVYVKFIEAGAVSNTSTLVYIGDASSNDARLMIQSNGAAYIGIHDPATLSTSSMSAAPDWGDEVELLLTLAADGTPILYQSINGATATVGTGQTAQALADDWSGARLYLGSEGGTGNVTHNPILSVKVASGVKTLAEMREALA